ncbi:MAG: ABC transporter permease, partial [Nitrospinae bacterium]|nr:ABC transporter permease [Nitrospinota bacterium]
MLVTQLKIAYRSVLRNRRKTAVTFFAVCFGTASIIVAGGFFDYMFYALHAAAVYGQHGHIQAYAHGFMEKGVVSPFSYMIEDFNEFNSRYSKVPHVRFIMPRIQFSGIISNGDTTGSFVGLGIDTNKEREMSSFSIGSGPAIRITSGNYLKKGDKNVIIIGKGLADAIGVKAGERVTLLTNTESGSINGVTVEIAGIFESFQKEFDDRAIQIPIETTQNLLRIGNKFQTAVFVMEDSSHVDSTVNILKDAFAGNGEQYEIRTWKDLALFHNSTVALFSRIFFVINIVIALV